MIVSFVLSIQCSCSTNPGRNDNTTERRIVDNLAKINDNPYVFDDAYSPAASELIKIGVPVIENGLLELLVSEDYMTRLRASRVLMEIIEIETGRVRGVGWKDKAQEQAFLDLWRDNGSYRADLPPESLRIAYEKWVRWVKTYDAKKI
jgi:hypothetical protein